MDREFEIAPLLDAVYTRYGYDFRHYSEAHVLRRIRNRMILSGIQTLFQLQVRLMEDEFFASQFLQDLSITVTEMFRDPAFYKSLREKVIPVLKTYPFIKIWHAGCSSGEEVYSMAIVLQEEGLYDRTTIYATDFNQLVLNKAKAGIFSNEMIKEYTINYQLSGGCESFSDYYTSQYDHVIMNQSLKKNIVWANHNLVTDNVFAEVHMILCRNVLIYFDRTLQNRVQVLFYESLINGGILCLGTKEGLRFMDVFKDYAELDKRQRIYKSVISMRYEAIVIGVSAGGLNALKIIFAALPADFGMPLIVVQHVGTRSDSEWIKLMDQKNQIRITEIEEKQKMEPGTAYFAPPNYHVLLERDKTFSLSADPRVNFARPSVDVLFDSAADVLGDKLIGIVLTGANNDGAEGLKKIKAYGGLTIVEDPETSHVPVMPRAAIKLVKPDYVLSLPQIGNLLLQLDQQQKNQPLS